MTKIILSLSLIFLSLVCKAQTCSDLFPSSKPKVSLKEFLDFNKGVFSGNVDGVAFKEKRYTQVEQNYIYSNLYRIVVFDGTEVEEAEAENLEGASGIIGIIHESQKRLVETININEVYSYLHSDSRVEIVTKVVEAQFDNRFNKVTFNFEKGVVTSIVIARQATESEVPLPDEYITIVEFKSPVSARGPFVYLAEDIEQQGIPSTWPIAPTQPNSSAH